MVNGRSKGECKAIQGSQWLSLVVVVMFGKAQNTCELSCETGKRWHNFPSVIVIVIRVIVWGLWACGTHDF